MKFTYGTILCLLILIGCATPQIAVDYDRSFDFSTIKTYQFENQTLGIGKFDSIRIYDAIQNALKAKGLSVKENPDAVIKIMPDEYISQQQGQTVGVGVGGGNGGFGGGFGGGVSVGIPIGGGKKVNQNYRIELYQQSTNQLFWEGTLDLSWGLNASPDQKQTAITNGVNKLFAQYPPDKS